VNVLRSRAEVRADRLAVTGASLGGELAVMYAAIDRRIGVVAASSFTPPRGAYPAAVGTGAGEQPHYCHTMPAENSMLLQEDWFYLIAPRPLISIFGSTETPHGLELLFTPYSSFGFADRGALVVVPDRGHEFFVLETAAFLKRHLGV
jgi:hypothetical protein